MAVLGRLLSSVVSSSASSSSSSTASEINLEQCDSRAEVLKEDMQLASVFIKTLFAVLYEVYSSSVSQGDKIWCSCMD